MPQATVWLGDFNTPPDSEEYRLITAQRSDGPNFVDCWAHAGPSGDDGVTYFDHPQAAGGHSGLRIDYGFVTPELAGQLVRAWVDGDAVGSDHQPIWLELDR